MTVTRRNYDKQWNQTMRSSGGRVEKDQSTEQQMCGQVKGQASKTVIHAPVITGCGPEIE